MENIYTILDWICSITVAILILYAIIAIGPTGWEEEKETKKSS